jgi:hypothetical protein
MSVIDMSQAQTESPFPPAEERPQYVVVEGWREHDGTKYRPGVYFCGIDNTKDGPVTFNSWICTPIHVEAVTHDEQGNNFGRLLRFKPTVGSWREWAMPMDMLRGSGDDLRGELLSMGVELDPREGKRTLPVYLQQQHPKKPSEAPCKSAGAMTRLCCRIRLSPSQQMSSFNRVSAHMTSTPWAVTMTSGANCRPWRLAIRYCCLRCLRHLPGRC